MRIPWRGLRLFSILLRFKDESMAERATKRRAYVPRQDGSGPYVGRCHCLGWLGMMAMPLLWYADLGGRGLLSAI